MTNPMPAVLFREGDITDDRLPSGFRKVVLAQVPGRVEDRGRQTTWQRVARTLLHIRTSLWTMVDFAK